MPPSPLSAGTFVVLPNDLGIGRIADADDSEAKVEYFESTSEPIAHSIVVPSPSVRPVSLGVQTRVFFQDESEQWHAGRVVGGGPSTYAVRLPNSDFDRSIPGARLRVRWEQPPKDPLPILTSGGNESPYYLNSRAPARALLLADRASCGGLTGVSSAAVAIHAHQVYAAFRVLRDPVKRYLLADEVGLGKTIEAGFVARQLLIDDPSRSVGVLAPEALCRQWRQELLTKFMVDDFPGPGDAPVLGIAAHERPEDWGAISGVDLLIVDEAHLLSNPSRGSYEALASLCHNVDRLLLLSATPFTQHHRTHLGLLHLLDPVLFSWENEEQFKGLLDHRRDVAMAVFGLDLEPDPDNVELVEFQLDRIRSLLPDDPVLAEMFDEALEALRDGEAPTSVDVARRRMLDVRTHISETYRLHHRVIRNRRHTVETEDLDESGLLTPFQFTGRRRPVLVRSGSDSDLRASAFVSDWYRVVSDEVLNRGLDPTPYGSLLALLVSRLGVTSSDLRILMQQRLAGSAGGIHLESVEGQVVREAPVLDAEAALFADWETVDEETSLHEVAIAIVKRVAGSKRVVVFCGRGSLANEIADALRAIPSGPPTVVHTVESSEADRDGALATWASRGGILVVDHSGDVGQNFQHADVAVHLRLPTDASLLEQRIGRVDRYGEQAGARQLVLGEPARDGLQSAWLRMLVDGFAIFDRSISAVQEVTQQLSADLWRDTVAVGLETLTDKAETVATKLSAELRRVNELDALESTFEQDELGRAVAARISEFDGQADVVQRSFNELITGVSGFRFRANRLGDGAVTYTPNPLADPLLSPRLLTRMAVPEPIRTGVYDRWRMPPGRRILRRGNPFIDGLAAVMELDDRGQAAALWRLDPRLAEDPVLYFGFDFVVQADPVPLLEELVDVPDALLVALRRGDMALPPFARRVWVRAGAVESVSDERDLRFLNAPYKAIKSDVNLAHKRAPALYGAAGGREAFAHAAVASRTLALEELIRTTDMTAKTAAAAENVRRDTDRLLAQVRARSHSRDHMFDLQALELEAALGAALERGVVNPQVRTASAICVVRAAQSWSQYV